MLVAPNRFISKDRKVANEHVGTLKPKVHFQRTGSQVQQYSGQYRIYALSPSNNANVIWAMLDRRQVRLQVSVVGHGGSCSAVVRRVLFHIRFRLYYPSFDLSRDPCRGSISHIY